MKLSREQFCLEMHEERAVVMLIGPSGQGKSWWSTRLAQASSRPQFGRRDCDAEIAALLAPELATGGHLGIAGVSDWMGQPYDLRYPENQARYIAAERKVMRQIASDLRQASSGNVVIDSTGSAMYADSETLEYLRQRALIIYLKASEADMAAKRKQYFDDPKPIAFMEYWDWDPCSGESQHAALERCFDAMVRGRAKPYAASADVTIGWRDLSRDAPPERLLEVALERCPAC